MLTPDTKANKPKDSASASRVLRVTKQPGIEDSAMLAQAALRPSAKAAVTTQRFSEPDWGELDLTAVAEELSQQVSSVVGGDLRRVEAMLISQAHTLETLFHELARRAGLNMGGNLHAAETYLRLALRAQNQCRATLETLGTIKNPAPVAFVRQANIAHGPQQVNNAPPLADIPRARKSEIVPNELLEATDGKRLDPGATTPAVGADSDVETVGTFDRT